METNTKFSCFFKKSNFVIYLQIVEFYEELFDYKFPLEKMDMAAIPDFQVIQGASQLFLTFR